MKKIKVLKEELVTTHGFVELTMRRGRILSAGVQQNAPDISGLPRLSRDVPVIWVEADCADTEYVTRRFLLLETGAEFPVDNIRLEFIDTLHLFDARYVLHVYEVLE